MVSVHVSSKFVLFALCWLITIAPKGLGKSLTYWMPLLYIKHGIIVVVESDPDTDK